MLNRTKNKKKKSFEKNKQKHSGCLWLMRREKQNKREKKKNKYM